MNKAFPVEQVSTANPFSPDRIFHLGQTTSTMDEARKLSANHPCGAVRADAQTTGRGRLPGRTWNTQAGQALLATAWFPRSALYTPLRNDSALGQVDPGPSGHQPPVALMAGLAVAKACLAWAEMEVCPFRHGIAIKWPNDVLCGTSKIAGILCEATANSIYVGMGINCLQEGFTGEFRTKPTSILMETGRAPDRGILLAMILGELQTLISGPSGWLGELDYLLAWKGKKVDFRQGLALGEPHRGILLGIAEDGALLVQIDGSTRSFHSGEISLVIDVAP